MQPSSFGREIIIFLMVRTRNKDYTGSGDDRVNKTRVHGLGTGLCSTSMHQCSWEQPVANEQDLSNAIIEGQQDQAEGSPTSSNPLSHSECLSLPLRPCVYTQGATSKQGRGIRNEAAGRVKWTKEANLEIIGLFYLTNNCQDQEGPAWRQKLFAAYCQKHPGHTLTEQNIADRKRVIIKNNYVTEPEREQIKREVGSSLFNKTHLPANEQSGEFNVDKPCQHVETTSHDEDLQFTKEPILDQDFYHMVEEHFNMNIAKYEGSSPCHRLMLARFNPNKYSNIILLHLNKIVSKFLADRRDFSSLHLAVYCSAATVQELLHIPLKSKSLLKRKPYVQQTHKPQWQHRIEQNIRDLRCQIGRLTAYLRGEHGDNLIKNIRPVLRNIGLKNKKMSLEDEGKVIDHLDTLKQKLKAKGARLARYQKTTRRKIQNKLFRTNQKQFYRTLDPLVQKDKASTLPTREILESYWSGLWSNPVQHDRDASWLPQEYKSNMSLPDMNFVKITLEDLQLVCGKICNWKAPGVDGIHNYWWKKLTSVHVHLVNFFNDVFQDPNLVPDFFTQGITYLLYKAGDSSLAKNYRPITCLPTVYKLLTSIIANQIYAFLDCNNVFTKEQKGCIKGSYGCKELLVIDSFILKQAQRDCRDLSVAYIDYQKAFDSVPHSWLIEVLKIYKVDKKIVSLLSGLMEMWRTKLKCNDLLTDNIGIHRGIFQGDSLSPLWFCLALNPLSKMLNRTNYGYKPNIHGCELNVSHLVYMDDVKLFANSPERLHSLLSIVQFYSSDIQMKFGFDKCATLHIKNGKFSGGSDYQLTAESFIKSLGDKQAYKYLGIYQNHKINHTQIKVQFKQSYLKRLNEVLRTELTARNKISAINAWAVPVLAYSFGIIDWSHADLDDLDRKTRVMLTKYRNHHPKSCIERLYLPRSKGGRGLIDLKGLCFNQIIKLYDYFHNSKEMIHQLVVKLDNDLTTLCLAKELQLPLVNASQRIEAWLEKPLHGQHLNSLLDDNVDIEASTLWLKLGHLQTETEGFMCAIQDQVVPTRYYQRAILRQNVGDVCRACHREKETIHHIIAGCQTLAPTDYLSRHNQVAKIIYQQLAKRYGLLASFPPYYKFEPSPVIENESAILYWDKQVITDKSTAFNKPDIILVDKKQKKTWLIDIAVPSTINLQRTEMTKFGKYQDLRHEIKRLWKQSEVVIVPIVISATGVVPKSLAGNLNKLSIKNVMPEMQKSVILQTCHITRKFLGLD